MKDNSARLLLQYMDDSDDVDNENEIDDYTLSENYLKFVQSVEHVLHHYVVEKMNVEQLMERFDSLNKDEIESVISYYNNNKNWVKGYVQDLLSK